MNAGTITALGIAGASLMTALAAYLRALAAHQTANHAQARLDAREAAKPDAP